MSSFFETAADDDDDAVTDVATEEEVRAQLALLEEENERLRNALQHARQRRYRRTAFGFFVVGLLSAGLSFIFPANRTVLFTLAGIGLFGGVMSYGLTPERFVAAAVTESIHRSAATNFADIRSELGLQNQLVYVPLEDEQPTPAKLFVPQHAEYSIPAPEALETRFVVTDDELSRGLSLRPSGAALFTEFHNALSASLRRTPDPLAAQLVDGIVDQFELADDASTDAAPGELIIGVESAAFGDVTDFDHPIPSFVAVTTAVAMETAVTLDIAEPAESANEDALVICRWASDGAEKVSETETATDAPSRLH